MAVVEVIGGIEPARELIVTALRNGKPVITANKELLASLGVTNPSQLLDARTNAIVALAMYQRSGWGPWE